MKKFQYMAEQVTFVLRQAKSGALIRGDLSQSQLADFLTLEEEVHGYGCG